jgi:hypothetical protein
MDAGMRAIGSASLPFRAGRQMGCSWVFRCWLSSKLLHLHTERRHWFGHRRQRPTVRTLFRRQPRLDAAANATSVVDDVRRVLKFPQSSGSAPQPKKIDLL